MALLYEGSDWDFDKLRRVQDAIEEIALGELGLDVYPNQIEVISAEQMLDAYSSHGLPQMYRHWSFGKRFARDEALYRTGRRGLAYEIVINSSPCISYIMEENSMTMQTLVIAHAAYGHNHFFKNNSFFRQWTDAEGILDYLSFAKRFVAECEEKHGIAAVERILDAAHALEAQGVDRYSRRPRRLSDEKRRAEDRAKHLEETWNPLWSTLPGRADAAEDDIAKAARALKEKMRLPEENLLYFVEKNAPRLKGWERELIRIVRKVSQYFYPQKQTKIANEGCATWTHMEIMTRLNDRGRISDGSYLEFLDSHSGVINQHPRAGWNPYALGFAIMNDVKRMCLEPTDEDMRWFPAFAGNQDPYGTLREAWADYRDDGLILQYLSPKVMRDFRMFHVADREGKPTLSVDSIHDEDGYRAMRSRLAANNDVSRVEPDVNVTDVDLMGDRRLVVTHSVVRGRRLDPKAARGVATHLNTLWGYPVRILERDSVTDAEMGRVDCDG